MLPNGVLLRFSYLSINCIGSSVPTNDSCGEIYIDVNGFKGPNKVGRDIFGLSVLNSGATKPFGSQGDIYFNDPTVNSCDSAAYPSTFGWSCSATSLYQ